MAVQPKQVLRLLRTYQDTYLPWQQCRRARVFNESERPLVCRRDANESQEGSN